MISVDEWLRDAYPTLVVAAHPDDETVGAGAQLMRLPQLVLMHLTDGAPRDLSNRLMQRLGEWTGTRWAVVVSQAEGAPTLEQQAQARDSEMKSEVAQHPLVRAVLDAFPGATIAAVRERFAAAGPAADTAEDEPASEDDAVTSEEDEP